METIYIAIYIAYAPKKAMVRMYLIILLEVNIYLLIFIFIDKWIWIGILIADSDSENADNIEFSGILVGYCYHTLLS